MNFLRRLEDIADIILFGFVAILVLYGIANAFAIGGHCSYVLQGYAVDGCYRLFGLDVIPAIYSTIVVPLAFLLGFPVSVMFLLFGTNAVIYGAETILVITLLTSIAAKIIDASHPTSTVHHLRVFHLLIVVAAIPSLVYLFLYWHV